MPKNNASWPGTPKPEPNPLITNPDGSQSPNPRYQGPNRYRKGPDGKLTRVGSPKAPKPGNPGKGLGRLFGKGGPLSILNPMTVPGAIASLTQLGGSEDPSIKYARLGYESPEAYQKAIQQYEQRTGKSATTGKTTPRSRGMADLRGSVTPGSNQPAADNKGEGAAMDRADRFRPGAGYPEGVQRPGDYPVQSRNTAPPNPNPDPTIPAKGTLTGGSVSVTPFDMDGFLKNIATPQGVNMRNRFASHQLPGTVEHGSALGMTPGEFKTAQGDGSVVQLNNGRYVKTADLNNDNEGAVKTDGLNMDATVAEVDSFYGVGNNQADDLEEGRTLTPQKTNWLGRTAADNSDPRVAASRAFLDAENTMQGLRRSEGLMGVAVQGGRYATQDAEGNTVELDKAGYQKMMSGEPLAQDFLDQYKSKVAQAATETVQEVTAGADEPVIESIDGVTLDTPISVTEYNKRFPNDNK